MRCFNGFRIGFFLSGEWITWTASNNDSSISNLNSSNNNRRNNITNSSNNGNNWGGATQTSKEKKLKNLISFLVSLVFTLSHFSERKQKSDCCDSKKCFESLLKWFDKKTENLYTRISVATVKIVHFSLIKTLSSTDFFSSSRPDCIIRRKKKEGKK